jgi:long-chain acyl-CoA synthetase
MGSGSSRQIIYGKYEKDDGNLSGPLINTQVNDYSEVTEYYKDRSWIGEFLREWGKYAKSDCLGFRKHVSRELKDKVVTNNFAEYYSWYSYEQVVKMSHNLAKNLIKNHLCSYQKVLNEGEFNFLGFFSRNMVEYLITDLACMLSTVTAVPLYATLGEEAFEYINKQTELTTLCISPDENIDILIKYKNKFDLPQLKNVIIFDMTLILLDQTEAKLKEAGFNVYYFSELIKDCENSEIKLQTSKPDSVHILCYTSGTTGLPKGAKITQRNLIAQMRYLEATGYNFKDDETILFYLPLAHVMERVNCLQTLLKGSRLGCVSGEVRASLLGDLKVLQPTGLVGVPRVLSLFRMQILKRFDELSDGWVKSTAINALNTKRDNFYNQHKVTHSWYDLIVFKKVRDTFGGKLRVLLIGSAPLPKEVNVDIKILFSIPIIEAYGMTECTGSLVCTNVNDLQNNSVGGCLWAAKYKLEDIPDLNYHSKTEFDGKPSPTGEICIYGPLVFAGYFKNEEITRETIDKDGWLHTGDIGRIMPDNLGLRIIDRKKEIFKLSQGEYIAPTKLEAIYGKSKFVLQIIIHGDPFHDHIVAIVVPNREEVITWLKSSGKISADTKLLSKEVEEYFKDPDFESMLKSDFEILAKENNFNSLEKISCMVISNVDFTIDNGCLTPTLKIVRRKSVELMKDKIDEVYNKRRRSVEIVGNSGIGMAQVKRKSAI